MSQNLANVSPFDSKITVNLTDSADDTLSVLANGSGDTAHDAKTGYLVGLDAVSTDATASTVDVYLKRYVTGTSEGGDLLGGAGESLALTTQDVGAFVALTAPVFLYKDTLVLDVDMSAAADVTINLYFDVWVK